MIVFVVFWTKISYCRDFHCISDIIVPHATGGTEVLTSNPVWAFSLLSTMREFSDNKPFVSNGKRTMSVSERDRMFRRKNIWKCVNSGLVAHRLIEITLLKNMMWRMHISLKFSIFSGQPPTLSFLRAVAYTPAMFASVTFNYIIIITHYAYVFSSQSTKIRQQTFTLGSQKQAVGNVNKCKALPTMMQSIYYIQRCLCERRCVSLLDMANTVT